MQKETVKIVTHDGNFHSDEVFALAVLKLYFEKKDIETEITRTRNEESMNSADIVVDVGGVYVPEKNRFDHHQVDFNLKHEEGFLFASLGLIWKHFGESLCNDNWVFQKINNSFVKTIDAGDNGVAISNSAFADVEIFGIQSIINSFRPINSEDLEDYNSGFMLALDFAYNILKRQIDNLNILSESRVKVLEEYKNQNSPRILILNERINWEVATSELNETVCVIYPRANGTWGAQTIADKNKTFQNKAYFPVHWRSLRDAELAQVSEIADAVFCHKSGFLFVCDTKGGCIKAAKSL